MEISVDVRHLHRLEEYEECVRMQETEWGYAPVEIVPGPIFVVAAETGGQVLGAFAGERMIGFTLAVAAMRGEMRYLHSHMTAVVMEWRDKGVARRLKLAQRDNALARRIALVEWTFDPLEMKNAYFNLVKLGAVVRRYIPNCYGVTTSPLHGSLPTDRLMAEWWVGSERVKKTLAGEAVTVGADARRIRVPGNIAEMKKSDAKAAEREQTRIREEFQRWIGEGYEAVGLEREKDGSGVYVMEKVTGDKA